MVKRMLQTLFALLLFWLFWQVIGWLTALVWAVIFLDVILAVILIPAAALVAWTLGGFCAERLIERDKRNGKI